MNQPTHLVILYQYPIGYWWGDRKVSPESCLVKVWLYRESCTWVQLLGWSNPDQSLLEKMISELAWESDRFVMRPLSQQARSLDRDKDAVIRLLLNAGVRQWIEFSNGLAWVTQNVLYKIVIEDGYTLFKMGKAIRSATSLQSLRLTDDLKGQK